MRWTTCIRCGYDLRGHEDRLERCPECGLDYRVDGLRFAAHVTNTTADHLTIIIVFVLMVAAYYGLIFAIAGYLKGVIEPLPEEPVLIVIPCMVLFVIPSVLIGIGLLVAVEARRRRSRRAVIEFADQHVRLSIDDPERAARLLPYPTGPHGFARALGRKIIVIYRRQTPWRFILGDTLIDFDAEDDARAEVIVLHLRGAVS